MPPKGESVQTYLPPELKRKLEAWALEDQRSISFLVAQILTEAITTKDKPKQKPRNEGDRKKEKNQ